MVPVPIQVLAISGSLRRRSSRTAARQAAAQLAPAGMQVDVLTPHDMPHYDADLELDQGIPAAAESLR